MNSPAASVECVWDYPRPPRLESTSRSIRVLHPRFAIADTARALRILETSHPPVYYLPPEHVAQHLLRRSSTSQSFCEFKGLATYWNLEIPQPNDIPLLLHDVAWSYEAPTPRYSALKGHLAFYANRLAEHQIDCWVDDERILPQAGDFYGGWITANLRGPFKGAPGTRHW
jgi:uncharacterized protein (DUF427 family)